MPRNIKVSVPARGTFIELTSGDIDELTFLNEGPDPVLLVGQAGDDLPTSSAIPSAMQYPAQRGEIGVSMAELFPGVSGANRVFATNSRDDRGSTVFVSHG